MILVTFELPRRLVAARSFSRRGQTGHAMVAGSCFSIALLHMMLITPCDTLIRNAGGLQGVQFSLTKYVGDLTLCVRGPTDACAKASWDLLSRMAGSFLHDPIPG